MCLIQMSLRGVVQRDIPKSKNKKSGDFTILTSRLCGGDYDAACCDLLRRSLVGNEDDDELNREGDTEG